tara:strand:+ start:117 stop:518 length:402 start_codon:yes stop_codon:yes gene_type:complete
MNKIILLILSLILVGCEKPIEKLELVEQDFDQLFGNGQIKYTTLKVDGMYIQLNFRKDSSIESFMSFSDKNLRIHHGWMVFFNENGEGFRYHCSHNGKTEISDSNHCNGIARCDLIHKLDQVYVGSKYKCEKN